MIELIILLSMASAPGMCEDIRDILVEDGSFRVTEIRRIYNRCKRYSEEEENKDK